jgi:hypothetical protein
VVLEGLNMVSRRLWVRVVTCVLIFGLGYVASILMRFREVARREFVEGFREGVQRGRERIVEEGTVFGSEGETESCGAANTCGATNKGDPRMKAD